MRLFMVQYADNIEFQAGNTKEEVLNKVYKRENTNFNKAVEYIKKLGDNTLNSLNFSGVVTKDKINVTPVTVKGYSIVLLKR